MIIRRNDTPVVHVNGIPRLRQTPWITALDKVSSQVNYRPQVNYTELVCTEHFHHQVYQTQEPRVLLITNARDESNIAEWTAHHLLLGFAHLLIFDDVSIVPINELLQVRLPKHLHARVTVLQLCKSHRFIPKKHFQADPINAAGRQGFTWAMHLDADEFLFFPTMSAYAKDGLGSWISTIGMQYPQVLVPRLAYGSNFHEKALQHIMLMETYTRHDTQIDRNVKSMCRCIRSWEHSAHWRTRTPHELRLYEGSKEIITPNAHVNGSVLNTVDDGCMRESGGCFLSYWMFANNRNKSDVTLSDLKPRERDVRKFPALIAHFKDQARDVCIARKLNRPRDDIGRPYCYHTSHCNLCQHNVSANSVLDKELLGKYVSPLKSLCPLCTGRRQ